MHSLSNMIKLLLLVRLVGIVSIILSDYIIPDHKAEGVDQLNVEYSSTFSKQLLNPFVKWDSVHYITIALYGYQKDYQFVFYPLYPLILHLFGVVPILSFCNQLEQIIVLGVIFNLILGCLSVILLHKILTRLQFPLPTIKIACYCYIFNPAFIFFIVLYTESLFSMLSWLSFYCFLLYPDKFVFIVPAFFACCVRSNGILIILPIAISIVINSTRQRNKKKILNCLPLILLFIPSIAFTNKGYEFICTKFTVINMTVNHSAYCQSSSLNPIHLSLYSYLQRKYWNVYFLSSFQLRQLPNICLAIPIILISAFTLKHNFSNEGKLLPWKIHLLITLLIGTCWAHIQISTRMICSSSPLIYVGLTTLMSCKLIKLYLIVFIILGLLLHCNFYPWI
jgi:phosphatidylinositol glycan class V